MLNNCHMRNHMYIQQPYAHVIKAFRVMLQNLVNYAIVKNDPILIQFFTVANSKGRKIADLAEICILFSYFTTAIIEDVGSCYLYIFQTLLSESITMPRFWIAGGMSWIL